MSVEVMKAVCCLVVRPLRQHQQAALAQNLKQPVAANLNPPVSLAVQQIVQLACTQPRLAHPDLMNKLNDPIRLTLFAVSGPIALVVSLATDA
ncbi:hypothetical protein D3C78_1368000 [compost metagenome]